ncbi:MAG: sensor histidine kinase [Armatimonadota bacterium]
MPTPSANSSTMPCKAPAGAGAVWRCLLLGLLFGIAGIVLTILLYIYSGQSTPHYLLYHSLIELFSVGVGVAIFAIGWNTRRFAGNSFLLVLAVAFLFVGLVDTLHTLAYKGMGVFPDAGANLPTQYWIAARYIESVSLLFATLVLFTQKTIRPYLLFIAYLAGTLLLLYLISPAGVFPVCYVELPGGTGYLTPFKIVSEYVISALVVVAGLFIWWRRDQLDPQILQLILVAIVIKVLSEYSFTLYRDVTGFYNFIGHIFKLVFTALVYMALVRASLLTPYRSIFRDLVSSQEQLNEELEERRQAEEALRRSQEEREELMRTISHDLRAPLTIIRGHAEVIPELLQAEPAAAQESLAAIERSVDAMNAMIQDLVDAARLEGGQITLELAPIRPAEYLPDLLQRLSTLVETGRIMLQLDPGLPPVLADRNRLDRIMLNLLTNALKYSPPDSPIEIRASREGAQVAFSVVDRGQGIDPDDVPHIFDRFYRPKAGRKAESVGLGLYITRGLVEAHGGRIEVTSAPGKGSTFTFTLPVA